LSVVPSATVGVAGLMAMVCSNACDTVRVAVAVTGVPVPKDAVMTLDPTDTPRARPLLPATLDTVARAGVAELQATVSVRS
jgi:hypothetical protein